MLPSTSSPNLKVPLERDEEGRPRFKGCSSIREYEFLGKLGEGTFGEVYKARSKHSGSIVALKKILLHNEKDGFPITALREIKLLKVLSHTNIIRLEEMAVERSRGEGRKKPSMYMVTPYMEHDLAGLLENPNVHLTEPQIKCYMLQLLEGLRYLHQNNILHRDMKDFGLARPYDGHPPAPGKGGGEAVRDYTSLVVTRWYRPPELLLQLRRYTTAIDMWGAGCVFGEMFKGKPILAGSSDLNQAQLIFTLVGSPTEETMPGWSALPGCEGVKSWGSKPGNLSTVFREQGPGAISLLSELLKLDWRKRINAIDALKHPYFLNPPLPARPGDLPQFEDSHELDRRKFRGQKAMPPAPAGGSVGMGANGEWTSGSGVRVPPDPKLNSRIPSAARNGPRGAYDSRVPDSARGHKRQASDDHPPRSRDPSIHGRPPGQLPGRPNAATWRGGDRREQRGRDEWDRHRSRDSYVPKYDDDSTSVSRRDNLDSRPRADSRGDRFYRPSRSRSPERPRSRAGDGDSHNIYRR
ncbi:pitalre-like kinase, putative [Coccidioides posadasii C735 delta SOWgp]|uniref:Serine/threonine-protein kinase BUR1 n=1 Tax=Coccidioides posadasii (strain C735) TaxID=222929 RepID=C5P7X9_COCP7|nr:pitalre-like kinase, putative [Coccidioides posadasii C735 delta SOWgp]EER27529.1 pitalre-like kinase, putative [Coccidioides posadasii C735 delta SOWgp]|eukprot:XP_003069674.1 pitalre-like kinase, putative [Coccidioides posadasii C735 delta SOWgp]